MGRRWALLAFVLIPALMQAQQPEARKPGRQYVAYVAEAQQVPAGRTADVQVRFHVADGFHVNSHRPKSEFLLATKLEFQPADGVKAGSTVYPAGKEFHFSFSPDVLDVYSDDFTVKLPVEAAAGQHTLAGMLTYQACDHAACYPPRTLPVEVLFKAQ